MKYSVNSIADVSYQCEHYTGKLWDRDKCVAKHFSVIRRGKESEATDGTHVRMAAIPSENGDLVRWRLGSIEINQYERYDGFAEAQALKVFPMSVARAASQRHTEHGHHKMTAILDATFACFHTDMDELIRAHPPRETEPDCNVVWLLFKAHSGARRAARLWQEYFCHQVLMSAGWKAEAMEPDAYHEAEDLDDNDDATLHGHRDSFEAELKIDVLQDANAMKEHKVDITVSTIIGTEAKILKQVSSWKPACITWVRVELRAAALTPNTATNTSDELSWDRAKARSLAGGIAIHLVPNRLDVAYDIEELIERIGHEAVAENLNDAGMNSTNSEVNSEEPECVWTVLCQATTQKSVRKAYTSWTDQNSEDQKCFGCVTVRMGDRVINVECTKQDVIALSAIQSESHTLTTGELGRVLSEDNETDLGTKCLDRDHIKQWMTKM